MNGGIVGREVDQGIRNLIGRGGAVGHYE
jgi:hypothetical protein